MASHTHALTALTHARAHCLTCVRAWPSTHADLAGRACMASHARAHDPHTHTHTRSLPRMLSHMASHADLAGPNGGARAALLRAAHAAAAQQQRGRARTGHWRRGQGRRGLFAHGGCIGLHGVGGSGSSALGGCGLRAVLAQPCAQQTVCACVLACRWCVTSLYEHTHTHMPTWHCVC